MKYLRLEQLITNLSIGKLVEQWIGYVVEKDYVILKWIRIEKEKNEFYSVIYTECFDEGNEDFLDLYEFSPIDPDESFGIINTFSTVDEAIAFALKEYRASINNFLNDGMIQDEYLSYLKNR